MAIHNGIRYRYIYSGRTSCTHQKSYGLATWAGSTCSCPKTGHHSPQVRYNALARLQQRAHSPVSGYRGNWYIWVCWTQLSGPLQVGVQLSSLLQCPGSWLVCMRSLLELELAQVCSSHYAQVIWPCLNHSPTSWSEQAGHHPAEPVIDQDTMFIWFYIWELTSFCALITMWVPERKQAMSLEWVPRNWGP